RVDIQSPQSADQKGLAQRTFPSPEIAEGWEQPSQSQFLKGFWEAGMGLRGGECRESCWRSARKDRGKRCDRDAWLKELEGQKRMDHSIFTSIPGNCQNSSVPGTPAE
ncbi:hypothetical protein P7K49_039059, partial [Saguinus oedipus]